MALTLEELCAGAEKDYGMTLIAGEKGLDNMVQWVHYIESGDVPRFLHGYELVFTTGMENHDADWLVKFAERLHEYGACGFVINLGPYVKDVPEKVIEYCNNVALPLYTIPWETRIVDITYEFCHHIVTDEKMNRSRAEAFMSAISNPSKEENYKEELEKNGFSDGEEYAFAAMKLKVADKTRRESAERTARYGTVRALNKYTTRHSVFMMDKLMLIICQGIGRDEFENEMEKQAETLSKAYPEDKIYVGTSSYEDDSKLLARAYKRACGVVKLAESYDMPFAEYSKTGMYKLLMAVEDKSSLKEYYDDCLGLLIKYDEKNNTDYVKTLRLYLDNDSSIAEVARITFVHRNTVNYKIKKIKDILGCEFNQRDKLRLTLAFAVEKII